MISTLLPIFMLLLFQAFIKTWSFILDLYPIVILDPSYAYIMVELYIRAYLPIVTSPWIEELPPKYKVLYWGFLSFIDINY